MRLNFADDLPSATIKGASLFPAVNHFLNRIDDPVRAHQAFFDIIVRLSEYVAARRGH